MSINSPLRITAEGDVFVPAEHSDWQSCTFPSVAVLPNGRWICAFRAAPLKGPNRGQRPCITWSDDRGESWSAPMAPFRPCSYAGRPGLFRTAGLTALGNGHVCAVLSWIDHSQPELPLFNESTQGLLDARIYLARSMDQGHSWSDPESIETGFDVPVPTTGPILRLANGQLACQFEVNKPYDSLEVWHHKSVLLFSHDEGRSWSAHSVASYDPTGRMFYWDQRPAVLADGRVLDLFWTFDNGTSLYRPIHARESRDHGRTWSELRDTGVPGQPAAAVQMGDGRVALVHVDRTAAPRIAVRTSTDQGHTWPAESAVVIYDSQLQRQEVRKHSMQDAWSEMKAFSVGLPATARTAEGHLLVVYYAGQHADFTKIRWSLLS